MRSNSRSTTRRHNSDRSFNHSNATTGTSMSNSSWTPNCTKLIVAALMFCSFCLVKMSMLQLQYDYFDGNAMEITGAANAGKINFGGDTGDTTEYLWNGKQIFYEAAQSLQPITDKVTYHAYQVMYGMFLLPYYHLNPTMKMLEIGLGCDMGYGPGASVALYQKLFPKAELWEAEYDAECVQKHKDGMLKGINILIGDQGNDTVLDEWIRTSGGGGFDIVIDDGGHQNCQIWHSFKKFWPTIKPGGLYFIEDMHVAKQKKYRKATTKECDGDLLVPEMLKDYVDELIYDINRKSDIEFIFCQSEACVLGKKNNIT